MPCQDCNNPSIIPVAPTLIGGCPGCGSGCTENPCAILLDTTCVAYTGPDLTCIGATTNTCLELIIQKIDAQLCTVIGDYSGFDLGCLRADYTINTAQQFAESVSDYVCTFRTDFDTFVDTTFVDYQADVDARFDNLEVAGFTSCVTVGIVPADTLRQTLVKLSGNLCNVLASFAAIPTANWSQCFTVLVPPTTLVGALNVLLDQICQVAAATGVVIPTFNNIGSCLPTPGASDSLVDTIIKIRTRLCQTPTFSAANLAVSTCVQFSGSSTLEDVIDAQNSAIDQVSQASITAITSAFTLTPVDVLEPCLGMELGLNTSVVDRRVALDNADLTPGTLFDKVVAGTNVTLDFGILNAGKLTISATGGVPADEKTKATALDPSAGFLDAKLIGGTNGGLTISATPTVTNDQIQIMPNIDFNVLVNLIFDEIEADDDLRDRFCAIVASCPSPCDAPSGISVSYS